MAGSERVQTKHNSLAISNGCQCVQFNWLLCVPYQSLYYPHYLLTLCIYLKSVNLINDLPLYFSFVDNTTKTDFLI